MLTSIKGYYENGQVILEELPTTNGRVDVIITFTEELKEQPKQKRQFGSMKGLILKMDDDFNDPLDDLKDYM
jgi:hypothetical protein